MLLHIPGVLTAAQVSECRQALDKADWADGRATAGYQSAKVKNNQQLAETHPTAQRLGDMILGALDRNPLFFEFMVDIEVRDVAHLQNIVGALRVNNAVESVDRMRESEEHRPGNP